MWRMDVGWKRSIPQVPFRHQLGAGQSPGPRWLPKMHSEVTGNAAGFREIMVPYFLQRNPTLIVISAGLYTRVSCTWKVCEILDLGRQVIRDASAPGLRAEVSELCSDVLGSWISISKAPCALPGTRWLLERCRQDIGLGQVWALVCWRNVFSDWELFCSSAKWNIVYYISLAYFSCVIIMIIVPENTFLLFPTFPNEKV